jgi:hypothetical protein
MGLLVHLPLGRGELLAPDAAPHEHVHEDIGPPHQESAEAGAAQNFREHFGGPVPQRPCPGVPDHKCPEPLRMAGGHPETDRPTPVLHHQGDLPQRELLDEAVHHPGVLGDRVPVAGRSGGQPEARVVQCNAPEPVRQPLHDVPIEERPGGVAMQGKKDRPVALVDVVHVRPTHVQEAAIEREQLVAHPRRSRHHQQLPPTLPERAQGSMSAQSETGDRPGWRI